MVLRTNLFYSVFSCLCLCFFLLKAPYVFAGFTDYDPPEFVEKEVAAGLIAELRSGGYVLYMRHGKTDPTKPDQVPMDLADCGTQRPLTEEGRDEIAAVGKAVSAAGIPVGEVLTSPLCRAMESAQLAFGSRYQVEELLKYTAHLTSEQKAPVVAKTRELISTPVAERGQNRVLVAHAPNLADLMGYFPETEGTVVVFKPMGSGNYSYLGSILPEQWDGLLDKE